jgi:ubiquitin-conjugating enzyme E2 O
LKLRLDGTIEVTHPNGSETIYPLSRLTKLYDSLEQFEDDGWEGEEYESDQGSHVDNGDSVLHLDSGGTWRHDLDDDGEWEDEDEEDEEEDDEDDVMNVDTWADEIEVPLDDGTPDSLIPRDVTPHMAYSASPFPASPSNTSPDATQEVIVHEDVDDDIDSPWRKFEILPNAPHDHAFYSSVPGQPSKNFLARLTKEYRALSNSLPGLFFCVSFIFSPN